MVRSSGDPLALAAAVRAQARALDPHALVSGITTMDAIVGRAMAPWRFAVWMFVLFAALAFLLATGGLFSLVALSVALRSREFAVRIALGAGASSITGRVLLEAGRRALLGTALGLAAAGAGSRWLASLLFEVAPIDVPTYAGAVAIVFAATLAAGLLPARSATRLDPMVLLRED
jgi:putative ABC transport system permease protein